MIDATELVRLYLKIKNGCWWLINYNINSDVFIWEMKQNNNVKRNDYERRLNYDVSAESFGLF